MYVCVCIILLNVACRCFFLLFVVWVNERSHLVVSVGELMISAATLVRAPSSGRVQSIAIIVHSKWCTGCLE